MERRKPLSILLLVLSVMISKERLLAQSGLVTEITLEVDTEELIKNPTEVEKYVELSDNTNEPGYSVSVKEWETPIGPEGRVKFVGKAKFSDTGHRIKIRKIRRLDAANSERLWKCRHLINCVSQDSNAPTRDEDDVEDEDFQEYEIVFKIYKGSTKLGKFSLDPKLRMKF